MNIRGLGFLHASGAISGSGVFPRALNAENGAAMGQQCGKLAALDTADFEMVGGQGEDGCSGSPAKFRDVVGVAIQDGPTDASGRGGTGNLGQSSASNRLEDNRVRALQLIIGLNRLQDLRALSNRVVIRVNDASFHAQLARHLFRGLRLFDLIIVVIRGKGNQEAQFFHVYSTSPLWGTFLPYIQRPKYPMQTYLTSALRLVRFKAFASPESVGLDETLIGGQRLLRFRQAADATIRLTQLKVCSVTIRRKFFCDFETFDGAGGISLLEKRSAELESGHFIVGLRQHHLAQKGHGLLGMSLHEKCVTEMIPGDRIDRAKFQLGAKLSGRRFEIALTQVDEAHEKVRFGKPRIKLQSSFHLREATRKVFLLRVGLPEEKVNGRIVCV